LAAADERDQKVRERRLQLIEKDFATSRLIQFIESLIKRILEYPESIVDEAIALVQSQGGSARLEVSRKLEEGLSKIIKNAKEEMIHELRGLRSKYQDDDKLNEKIKEAIAEAAED